jgi:hypothetical protein
MTGRGLGESFAKPEAAESWRDKELCRPIRRHNDDHIFKLTDTLQRHYPAAVERALHWRLMLVILMTVSLCLIRQCTGTGGSRGQCVFKILATSPVYCDTGNESYHIPGEEQIHLLDPFIEIICCLSHNLRTTSHLFY